MKAALYTRVSTDNQFEDGYSIEAQQEKLEAYCKLKDITEYEFYTDGGWSGSNINRPEIRRMIEDIKLGVIDVVIVYKLDRLSRSQKDTIYLLEDVFYPNNCDFISLNENFDTTSPYGKAMIGILSVFAQLERENIRERTRMGMQERIKSGLWMGGKTVPYGYDYDSNLGILVPNDKADNVRQIFDLYLKGYTISRLATMYRIPSHSAISEMLSRITYTGKIPYNDEIFDGKHEAIIDEETFQKVQVEKNKRIKRRSNTSKYLLIGLCYCEKCGARMRYQPWGKRGAKIHCYYKKHNNEPDTKKSFCKETCHDANEVETFVVNALFDMTDKIIADDKPAQKTVDKKQQLQERYNTVTAKIKRLYNLYAENGDELLLETIKENQQDLDNIIKLIEYENKTGAKSNVDERQNLAKNLRNIWNYLSMDDKHRVLRIFINKIVIGQEEIKVFYNV